LRWRNDRAAAGCHDGVEPWEHTMMTDAAFIPPEPAARPNVRHRNPAPTDRLARDIRAEFLEMPRLSLTLAQAARLFDTDLRRAKRALVALVDEGFLVRDRRGAYRRPRASIAGRTA